MGTKQEVMDFSCKIDNRVKY